MGPTIFQNDEAGRKAFEQLACKAIAWLVSYYESVEQRPVRSQVNPGDIYARFDDTLLEDPVSDDILFRMMDEVIIPGMTHWQHPNFYAFFPGNTSFPSIAAEILTSGLAAQCMMWESSPAAAELEKRCMEWCRALLGLPEGWEGAIQDTASTATLTALLTAREWKSGFRISKRGFDGTMYRVYASSQAHSSIEKAVRLAGIGTDNLVPIPTDEKLGLRPEALEKAILADTSKGFTPLCIISTIGTTGTGAVDPVADIGTIAEKYGLWHHVDAAYAGTALMLDEYAEMRKGLDSADSFVFNPHKWMFIQFDCSLYYVKDSELLVRTMSIQPSYLKSAYGDRVNDYRDWGIPLGRRFRALKIWMTLHLLGTKAIKERLRSHLALAELVVSKIKSDDRLEIPYPRSFNVVTVRIKSELDPDGAMTRQLVQTINDSGKAYMTHAAIENRSLIRWVTGQTYCTERHIEDTWEVISELLNKIVSS